MKNIIQVGLRLIFTVVATGQPWCAGSKRRIMPSSQRLLGGCLHLGHSTALSHQRSWRLAGRSRNHCQDILVSSRGSRSYDRPIRDLSRLHRTQPKTRAKANSPEALGAVAAVVGINITETEDEATRLRSRGLPAHFQMNSKHNNQ